MDRHWVHTRHLIDKKKANCCVCKKKKNYLPIIIAIFCIFKAPKLPLTKPKFPLMGHKMPLLVSKLPLRLMAI